MPWPGCSPPCAAWPRCLQAQAREEFNDLHFWRPSLSVEVEEEDQEEGPASPSPLDSLDAGSSIYVHYAL